jgi:CubicO group peptidase (beta-lactamase class C family)
VAVGLSLSVAVVFRVHPWSSVCVHLWWSVCVRPWRQAAVAADILRAMPNRTPLRPLLSALAVWWCIAAAVAAAQPAAAPPDLDAFVARAMRTFEVPGVALAVVKDGNVVVARGYGIRQLGNPAPVDARTLFGIASNTKVMTAAALGILVDEGRLEWDAPVVRYLPWFQMWDPWVTRELTVRDLLVHRSGLGLGAGDLLWWPPSTYDRKEIARRLRFIRPATSFRSAYAYDNVLYLVAGEVIEAVSGQTWEDFVSSRILRKAGMTASNVRHSDATGSGNVARTHARVGERVRPIAPFDSDTTNPAGGVNSGAEDMAKWLNVLLAHGRLSDGSRVFSESTWQQLTTIVTPRETVTPPPELAAQRANFRGYALGLDVTDYRGYKLLMHTGGLPGYVSRVMMIPDLNLGIAVLTNQEALAAHAAIAYRVADYYLGAPDTDWIDAYAKVAARQQALVAESDRRVAATRDPSSRPSLPLAAYAGTYADQWYGEIVIEQHDDKLVMRFSHTPALTGELEHFHHDTFIVRWRDRELRADAYVTFALNPDGTVDEAKMRAISPTTDFSFDFQDLLLLPRERRNSTGR